MSTTKELQQFASELAGYASDCNVYGPPAPKFLIGYARDLLLIAVSACQELQVFDETIEKQQLKEENERLKQALEQCRKWKDETAEKLRLAENRINSSSQLP